MSATASLLSPSPSPSLFSHTLGDDDEDGVDEVDEVGGDDGDGCGAQDGDDCGANYDGK